MDNRIFQLASKPGVRRDGTNLDSDWYSDGVWVRWQRGRVRKIGGYRTMSMIADGPIRSILVDARNGVLSAHYFSQYGIQRQQFSPTGSGGSVDDRTAAGFYHGAGNPLLTWSHAVMTSSTGGSFAALLACSTPDINDITSDATGNLFTGNMATTDLTTVVSDANGPIQVSGGVTVLQPFAVVYGSNGLIRNSNANDFSNSATPGAGWTVGGSGFANSANVAGTKFVYGAPVRGGSQSPAGLFWALDALVRMSFVGGTSNQWQYDTLSQPTSILGKKTVVEHDGKFFWIGTDRFLFYNGVVQELPNQMNCNWFFDNLNYAARNKVWGTKIPRWGEIWWFYPRGSSTECDNAIIFNYNENTWYDAVKTRSAGGLVQIFQYPVWAGDEDSTPTTVVPLGAIQVTSASTAAANAVLHFTDTTNVAVGMTISGSAGIPVGTTVVSFVANTSVTMSANATGSGVASGTEIYFSSIVNIFQAGAVATGGTSHANGVVVKSSATDINLQNVTGTFQAGETVTSSTNSATAKVTSATYSQTLTSVYQHEFGYDKIVGSQVSALISSFTSTSFGLAVGDPFAQVPVAPSVMTRIGRVELDYNQVGPLSVSIYGNSFAQQQRRLLETQSVAPQDLFLDFRSQERHLQIKFESNSIGGFFEQGYVQVKLDVGDSRSTQLPAPAVDLSPPSPATASAPQPPDAPPSALFLPIQAGRWPYGIAISPRSHPVSTPQPLYAGSIPVRLPPPTPFPYAGTMRKRTSFPGLGGIAAPAFIPSTKAIVPSSTPFPYSALAKGMRRNKT